MEFRNRLGNVVALLCLFDGLSGRGRVHDSHCTAARALGRVALGARRRGLRQCDGWVDIFLRGLDGPPVLYRNVEGKLEDITAASGLVAPLDDVPTASGEFGDVDNDDNDLSDLLCARLFINNGMGSFVGGLPCRVAMSTFGPRL